MVDSDIKLSGLHSIIQIVMGWYDCHLYSWNIGGVHYGEPDDEYESDNMLNENTVKLSKVVRGEKFKFSYTYDFGDSWEHEILVEKVLPATLDTRYPTCIAGKRACPPEDCGGAWYYSELLSILNDPENPEYEEKMEWLEEGFDPEEFNLKKINSRL